MENPGTIHGLEIPESNLNVASQALLNADSVGMPSVTFWLVKSQFPTDSLGGGFKYFLFSPLPGEMI